MKNDGGRAFAMGGNLDNLAGMTLRDYFAAKAMQACLSRDKVYEVIGMEKSTPEEYVQTFYDWADLMLKEREKC